MKDGSDLDKERSRSKNEGTELLALETKVREELGGSMGSRREEVCLRSKVMLVGGR